MLNGYVENQIYIRAGWRSGIESVHPLRVGPDGMDGHGVDTLMYEGAINTSHKLASLVA